MSRESWSREDQADVAVAKILDAASLAFLEMGVSQVKMGDIARYAGCSRGTLYNYFKSRDELHLAYVSHFAARLSDRVRKKLEGCADARGKFVEGVLGAVREVRADPGLLAWFEPGESGFAANLSLGSEAVASIAENFSEMLLMEGQQDRACSAEDKQLLARWFIRVIMSLLTMPGKDEGEERVLLERYAMPAILQVA